MFEMQDEIRLLFSQGKTDRQIVGNWKEFTWDFLFEQPPAAALQKYRKNHYHRKIDNVIAVIDSWLSIKPATKAPMNVLAVPQKAKETSSHTAPNAPCPCGSGKKYKKCCMMC